jgi:uncharacterized protein YodC (DUF2158 family)
MITEEFVEKIKPGDVVRLNSGGPDMTVKGIIGEDEKINIYKVSGYKDGDVAVEYFSNGKLEKGIFSPTSISKVEK